MQETGNNTSTQSLSIRFSAGGFSFFTGNTSKEFKFSHSDDGFARCRAICLCETDIWNDYKNVTAEIDDEVSSLFPSGLFGTDDCEKIMKFNYPSLNLNCNDISQQYIEGFDITNIFAVNKELGAFLKENFPYAKITHTSSGIIENALKSSRKDGSVQVWAKETTAALYVAVADNGNLLLSNRYSISNTQDILYFIGALYANLKLSQQNTPLFVCGGSSTVDLLKERVSRCQSVSI